MTDAPARDTHARVRTREQLLHVLHDDPRSVSREEIKAAFADGRLGEQDMQIPVLAGMRRITELLAELHPDDASRTEAGVASGAAVSGSVVRPAGMSVRLTELETRIAHLEASATEPALPSPTVEEMADLRASLARLEASLAERDSRLRLLVVLAATSLIVAVVAIVLAVLVH